MHHFALFLVICICWAGFSKSSSAQDTLLAVRIKSVWTPTLKSALVPGWGQVSRHEWLRGGVLFAGGAILAGSSYYYWQSQYSRPDWDQAGRIFDRDVAYGLAGWYSLGVIFNALDGYYTAAKPKVKNPTVAALLSIAFPGWGQMANGKHWKAMWIFALQTGLAYSVYYQHETALFYDSQGVNNKAEFHRNDRNRLIWWSVGAMIYSAADAFVDCHLRNWDVSENLSLAPVYFPENQGMGLLLRFPLQKP